MRSVLKAAVVIYAVGYLTTLSASTASNVRMMMNCEGFGRKPRGVIKVLSWHMSGRTEENHEIHQLG
jgi:hypothetical protein